MLFKEPNILDNFHNFVQRCMNASKQQNFVQNLITSRTDLVSILSGKALSLETVFPYLFYWMIFV